LGSGTGVVLRDPKRNIYQHQSKLSHGSTCNQAEYSALLLGLEEAKKLGVKNLEIRGDSKLVCYQITREWKCRAEHLKSLHDQDVQLSKKFDSFRISHIPREKNQ
jgi:ribonuclease HI